MGIHGMWGDRAHGGHCTWEAHSMWGAHSTQGTQHVGGHCTRGTQNVGGHCTWEHTGGTQHVGGTAWRGTQYKGVHSTPRENCTSSTATAGAGMGIHTSKTSASAALGIPRLERPEHLSDLTGSHGGGRLLEPLGEASDLGLDAHLADHVPNFPLVRCSARHAPRGTVMTLARWPLCPAGASALSSSALPGRDP